MILGTLVMTFQLFALIEDDLTAPSGGNAKIRFVNAAGGECWHNTCAMTFMLGTTDLGTAFLGRSRRWWWTRLHRFC